MQKAIEMAQELKSAEPESEEKRMENLDNQLGEKLTVLLGLSLPE